MRFRELARLKALIGHKNLGYANAMHGYSDSPIINTVIIWNRIFRDGAESQSLLLPDIAERQPHLWAG